MILWLTEKSILKSGPIRMVITSALQQVGVKGSEVIFNDLHIKTPTLSEHGPNKMPDKWAMNSARKALDDDIKILRPKLIVINDEDTLRTITGEKYALGTVRGSVYFYRDIPCVVCDSFHSMRYREHGQFAFELDLAKIGRWATGRQKNEPSFSLTICRNVQEVEAEVAQSIASELVATDTETAGGFITCVSYSRVERTGNVRTFVVPFFDPWEENGAYWKTVTDESKVRQALVKLNAAPVVKVLQNGTYDCAYFIKEGMPLVNYLVDTQNLMHSVWCEAPKSLHNIASYFVDHYTYWKDESKGVKEDGFGKDHSAIERYWRYNGLDSYYTLLGAVELLRIIRALPWAMRNYNSEFRLSIGPCLAASLRGIKVDPFRHAKIMAQKSKEAEEGREDLRRLSGEDDFNVNSTYDVAWLLYDVMGVKTTRLQRKGSKLGPRSTDEKVLKLMKEQGNAFANNAIDRILKAKKPAAVLSKYGDLRELCYTGNRFLSWHNAAGTDTFRLNSGSSQFWTGTNAQNFQPEVQEMFVADTDYVFVDADFSASDDWFIAHEAEDEDKIALLKSGRDVHCTHASVFFKRPYDEIFRGYKAKEEWVVHPITGVRQSSKKIAHGKNFRMQATMMYNLMGRDAAVATARAMGYANPERMTDKELIGMCDVLCDKYDHPRTGMYKRIRPWQDETVVELKRRDGLATNAFGITRKFFGKPDDHATQRKLSAYFGQSGTSGNANRSLNTIFWSGLDDGKNVLFLVQVHDSLKFLVHKSALGKIAEIKRIMEQRITIKGREFFVPVNIEVGLTDGKKMLPWREDITYEEIAAHEKKTYAEKFPATNMDQFINNMNMIDFDMDALDKELASRFGDEQDLEEEAEPEPL